MQMSGNVWEWCADWYDDEAYDRYRQGNLTPLSFGASRVLRGGVGPRRSRPLPRLQPPQLLPRRSLCRLRARAALKSVRAIPNPRPEGRGPN